MVYEVLHALLGRPRLPATCTWCPGLDPTMAWPVQGVLTSTILDVTTGAARVFLWRRLLLLLLGTAVAAATVAGSPLSSMRASAAGCMASSTTLMKKTMLMMLRPETILCGLCVEEESTA